jgi:hypothetical protein
MIGAHSFMGNQGLILHICTSKTSNTNGRDCSADKIARQHTTPDTDRLRIHNAIT